jgi:hypothetical protein
VSLADVELADGETPCPRCHTRPPYKDPWSQMMTAGAVFWPQVCLECAVRYDERLLGAVDE